MISRCLAGVLWLAAAPAAALTCLPADAVRTYAQARDAEELYVIVHGRLDFDAAALPRTDWQNQQATPPHTLIPARLNGRALSVGGFDLGFDSAIVLDAQCLGPWCAGAVPGTDYLAFLERRDSGYVLAIDPCGGMGFPEPTAEMLEAVETCFRGGPCGE